MSVNSTSYKIINGITLYRLLSAPLLLILLFYGYTIVFKWLLCLSFLTDLLDGYLARKYKVVSILGSRLDSAADDLTILVSIIAIIILRPTFISDNLFIIFTMVSLYLIQLLLAFIRYGKPSSFHTFLAKIAAVAQGIFILLFLFFEDIPIFIFYATAIITILDVMEEIVLVLMLHTWQADVKGIYWWFNKRTPTG